MNYLNAHGTAVVEAQIASGLTGLWVLSERNTGFYIKYQVALLFSVFQPKIWYRIHNAIGLFPCTPTESRF